MIVKDLRLLLEKLNACCTKALESSVGLCVNRGHYEVRWEHLLGEFLDDPSCDVSLILKHYDISIEHLKQRINRELENLRAGNTGRPSFSPPLVEAMEHAWSIGTLCYSLPYITSGLLFIAMLEKGQFLMSSYQDLLSKINIESLKNDFLSIVKTSSEQTLQEQIEKQYTSTAQAKKQGDVLSQFCTNFTEEARLGKIDPILGRDEEIRQAIDILNRRRKNNPILVGEAGVGKTAIVEGIALRIVNGDVPENLKNVELWGLDLGLLQAGASVKGEFEKRLKNVIDAVKSNFKSTILFIDEAHTLIGAGGAAGQGDAANLLKPALARGELRTLAATTWSEYRKYFEKDPALARRFQLVKIEEPSETICSAMLRGVAESFEKHHGVHISYDGINAAVCLSHRYISGRQLPDKAVDVLDTACARVKMSQSVKPAKLDFLERELYNTELQKKKLEKDLDNGIPIPQEQIEECNQKIAQKKEEIEILNEKWNQEKSQVEVINKLQNKLKEAKKNSPTKSDEVLNIQKEIDIELKKLKEIQADDPMVFPYVSAEVCQQVISDWTGIPIGSMIKDEAKTLLELENLLRERIIGQDEALEALATTIRASKTGLGNPNAPLGVFLFTGPSGVGKTECARALADILFGGEKFITTINMSEYQEKHTVSQLKGSPPGYVGYGEGGILTEAVRRKPYSVVLLDEVEKAHIEVMNLFYQVFDKGFMRDGEGREINFRNTIIIMTSNLASDTIIELCSKEGEEMPTSQELIGAIKPELSAHFQPALLARCKVIPFKPLTKEVIKGIVAMKLDNVAQRLKRVHQITLSVSPKLIDIIADSCSSVEAGARNADAVIDQTILPGISKQLLLYIGDESKKVSRCHIGPSEDGNFEILFSNDEEIESPTSQIENPDNKEE
jgi:type VI secretion system protein VasG